LNEVGAGWMGSLVEKQHIACFKIAEALCVPDELRSGLKGFRTANLIAQLIDFNPQRLDLITVSAGEP
jgi:hypothetical protein